MRRPPINITLSERAARMLVGVVAVLVGLLLLVDGASGVVLILELVLVLAGVDLLVTGVLGHCPLYGRLGYVPPSLRRTT